MSVTTPGAPLDAGGSRSRRVDADDPGASVPPMKVACSASVCCASGDTTVLRPAPRACVQPNPALALKAVMAVRRCHRPFGGAAASARSTLPGLVPAAATVAACDCADASSNVALMLATLFASDAASRLNLSAPLCSASSRRGAACARCRACVAAESVGWNCAWSTPSLRLAMRRRSRDLRASAAACADADTQERGNQRLPCAPSAHGAPAPSTGTSTGTSTSTTRARKCQGTGRNRRAGPRCGTGHARWRQ